LRIFLRGRRKVNVQGGTDMARVRGLRLLPPVGVIVTIILVFTLPSTGFRAAATQSYGMTDLGTLGGKVTSAYDLNDAAQVVGYSTTAFATHAFLWQNGQMTDLGTLNLGTFTGNASAAYAVNALGTAVGNSPVSNGNPRATMWRDGRIIDLTPDVAVYESSWASSINDAGRWTGAVQLEELPPWHGFVADGFTRTPLGHLGGGSSFPNDINNAGQVVGSSYTRIVDGVEQGARAFLWQNGVMTDLGVLPDDAASAAAAINSFGIIVGSSSRTNTVTFQETHRPFIYDTGSMTAIAVPSVDAQAADINDSGVVVGTMKASGGLSNNHAWVYQDGVVTNLNSLVVPGSGLHIAFAYAINNVGQIAGVAVDAQGFSHGVLLTPGGSNEPPPPVVPSLSIDDVTNAEGRKGTRSFTFTVSLSTATTAVVSVNFATANGSAIAAEDYDAASGTLVFAAGETTKTIVVGVLGDRTREPDESFSVNLSGASGATILDPSGTGLIRNDDR
jgi:probable HAF family extracellular repeat protein